jgi:hypothetical protein
MKRPREKDVFFGSGEPLVDESEIYSQLAVNKGSLLFLGRYSLNEVMAVLAKKSFLKEARKRFLWPLEFELDSSGHPSQRLRIFLKPAGPENLIVDLKVKEMPFAPARPPAGLPPFQPQNGLALEWLTIQNPLAKFTGDQIPLPGQVRPGLGIRKKIMDLFVYLARLMRKDCLLAFPAYYHNAVLFSRYFRFWNPYKEAEVLAIRRLFVRMPFKELAWVIHLNCLRRADGSVYEWKAEEQLFPLTRGLKDYFDSRPYREAVRSETRRLDFTIDREAFERKKRDLPFLCGGQADLL